MGVIKWHMNFVYAILVLNDTCDFKIELVLRARLILKHARMISDQTTVYSVQLPLLTCYKESPAIPIFGLSATVL